MQMAPFAIILVIMYFLILRPQQKRAKAHQEMIKAVRRGDTVVTSGGFIGKVTKVVDDNEIVARFLTNPVAVLLAIVSNSYRQTIHAYPSGGGSYIVSTVTGAGGNWTKGSHSFTTGQCPVMKYHRQLAKAIMHDKVHVAKAVNATVISLEDAPKGYQDFDSGASRKYIIDPHGTVRKHLGIQAHKF